MQTGVKSASSKTSYYSLSAKKKPFKKRFIDSRYLLLLVLPCIIYFILFHYIPMWGILISFKDYSPFKGFWGSSWTGFKHYKMFLSSPDAFKLIKNTFLLSFYSLIWSFPAPIIFALILNEVRNLRFKKIVQTVSYMPHFISTVVVVGMINMFLSPSTGIVNIMLENMGFKRINFMADPRYFRSIYIASGIWQGMGWSAIVYIAALSNIDPQLYEAAVIDGANKFKRIIHITIPCIAPTIITMFLLKTGSLLSVGFEKVFLMQQPATYSTSDVISTYVYRQGLISGNFGYSTAVGLFNSVINLLFLLFSNYIAKRYSETSLW